MNGLWNLNLKLLVYGGDPSGFGCRDTGYPATGGASPARHIVSLLDFQLSLPSFSLGSILDFSSLSAWLGSSTYLDSQLLLNISLRLLLLIVCVRTTKRQLALHLSFRVWSSRSGGLLPVPWILCSVLRAPLALLELLLGLLLLPLLLLLSLTSVPRHLRQGHRLRLLSPPVLLTFAARLQETSSGWTSEERIERAWRAGNWAGAVKQGRVGSPNRTLAIDLPNRHYVVLRGPGISSPRFFRSSRAFFQAVGTLDGPSHICHGSKFEAEVCVAGSETLQ